MKMRFRLLYIGLALLISSCTSNNYKNIDTVTGLHLFDENGSAIGLWNSPNDNFGNSVCYPNPGTGVLFLGSSDEITQVWILEGNCNGSSDESIREDATALSYTVEEIEDKQVRQMSVDNFNGNVSLNLTDLGEGFYRIFFMTASQDIFWQNVYIDPSKTNFADPFFLNDICG